MRPRRSVRALAGVAITVTTVVFALAGCTAASANGPHPSDSPAEHVRWGVPATSAPAGMTYQPDVKVVGGGKNLVWGATADAALWTLDANAPGMSDVHEGDVLYASSLVAGRVVSITRHGDRDMVALAPIGLTDLIKDGTVKYDTTIGATSGLLAQQLDTPVVTELPSGSLNDLVKTVADTTPAISNKAMPPPMPLSGGPSISAAGFDVGVNFAPDGLNVSVSKGFGTKSGKNSTLGLKIGVDFGLHFDKLRFSGSTAITGGRLTSSSTVLQGLKALTLTMTGGAADPAADNSKVRVEVPYTFEKALPPLGGVPTVLQIKVTFVIATAFTGRNATLGASAEYGISSSGNNLSDMQLTVKKSLVNSIGGLSLGPSGVVFGLGVRALVGVGIPGLAAGPYGKLSITVGVTNGSSIGASLARCRGATLDISGGIGAAGYLSTESVTELIKKFNVILKKRFQVETEAALDKSWSLFNKTVVVPNVPLCNAAAP